MVAKEYEIFWKRMQDMGLSSEKNTQKRSVFYYEHFDHDRKIHSFETEGLMQPESHADRLGTFLELKLKSDADAIKYCARVTQQIANIKASFYDQFIGVGGMCQEL